MSTLSQIFQYWRNGSSEPCLPKWQQLAEMSLLYLLRGIGPGYYIQSRWGRRSVPFADKWAHMGRSEYRAFIARWNPKAYQKASQHKLIEKANITLQKFPTPAFVGFVHKLRGRSAAGNPIQSAEQLESALKHHIGQRLCFKCVEGFGGFGFQSYVMEHTDTGLSMRSPFDGKTMSPSQWWDKYGADADGFLIEEYMEQHPVMAAINPTSVNTVRLWVAVSDHLCEVAGGHLRVGRNSSQVDNTSSGGLAGAFDSRTGIVSTLIDPLNAAAELDRHPDSKVMVKGLQLPHWEETKRLACDAIKAFPHMSVVGLDVAFGPKGPVLIELNVLPDYIGCAWIGLPLRQLERRMRGDQK